MPYAVLEIAMVVALPAIVAYRWGFWRAAATSGLVSVVVFVAARGSTPPSQWEAALVVWVLFIEYVCSVGCALLARGLRWYRQWLADNP
jgi:hypothetical protein